MKTGKSTPNPFEDVGAACPMIGRNEGAATANNGDKAYIKDKANPRNCRDCFLGKF